jgi:hypothetical protein
MICFIASVDTPAWRKNLSLYQPTRSAGRHGNLRRLKTWTLETFMVNVSSTPASFERGYAPAALRQRASTFWSRGAS